MKKTIAILLVLVIGMVGVFADGADAIGASPEASITLTTKINAFAVFGVTKSDASPLVEGDFASLEDFNEKVTTTTTYDNREEDDMYEFTNSNSLPVVGYLHGINNQKGDVKLSIKVDPFTSTNPTGSIPLTVSPTEKTLEGAGSTGIRGYFMNQPITVHALKTDVDLAPASPSYTTTITITVTNEG